MNSLLRILDQPNNDCSFMANLFMEANGIFPYFTDTFIKTHSSELRG